MVEKSIADQHTFNEFPLPDTSASETSLTDALYRPRYGAYLSHMMYNRRPLSSRLLYIYAIGGVAIGAHTPAYRYNTLSTASYIIIS